MSSGMVCGYIVMLPWALTGSRAQARARRAAGLRNPRVSAGFSSFA
jgi:hypothetical protein